MIFSLICATYGRREELVVLLDSILKQTIGIAEIEVIIVDQNKGKFLTDILSKYTQLNIKHIKAEKGLSHSRNIGIGLATGEIVAFPDDDCSYLPETLEKVYTLFAAGESDVVIGKIVDPEGNDIFRKWPRRRERIREYNYLRCCSSITLFVNRMRIIYFDERFGAGQKYGSSEDCDFVFGLIKSRRNIDYNPSILVCHPNEKIYQMPYRKIVQYGLGFGAFIRKNKSIINYIYFILICFRLIIRTLLAKGVDRRKMLISLSFRVRGFLSYPN